MSSDRHPGESREPSENPQPSLSPDEAPASAGVTE
jgi:hypothetical protein